MSDDLIERYPYADTGFHIEIYQDNDSPDVRDIDSNGIMLCVHPRYNLGDDREMRYMRHLARFEQVDELHRKLREALDRDKIAIFPRYLSAYYGATVVLPLYLYDHSMLSISAGRNVLEYMDDSDLSRRGRFIGDGAGWDTSVVGFIFDTAKTRATTGLDFDKVEEQLRAEVGEYDKVLQGEVYGYAIFSPLNEELDSCWGFVGEQWVKDSAADQAKYWADRWETDKRDLVMRTYREEMNTTLIERVIARTGLDPDEVRSILHQAGERWI